MYFDASVVKSAGWLQEERANLVVAERKPFFTTL